jgi:hypothetical protein
VELVFGVKDKLVGEKATETPAGCPLKLSVTAPVKVSFAAADIVYETPSPAIISGGGLLTEAESVKFGAVISVIVIVAVAVLVPLVPVAVSV